MKQLARKELSKKDFVKSWLFVDHDLFIRKKLIQN